MSVIVPVKNHLELTRRLVASVRAHNPRAAVEWIVVDSGSSDGTVAWCREAGARVVPFHREPFNYCAAVNAGAEAAGGEVWVVSNNDVEFRSEGALERLVRTFREWPLVSVVSPNRAGQEAGLQFGLGWLYGPCWAVRPAAFRAWKGLPEALSGYGYDEAHTVIQCWRNGSALAWLSDWSVFHHGGQTFGPLGATTGPVMRRNLSRLLRVLDAPELDRGRDRHRIMQRLRRRELEGSAVRLAVPDAHRDWLERQGYAGASAVSRRKPPPQRAAWVCGAGVNRDLRQWLPWLANELLLQPEARIVGAHGWYALRGVREAPDAAAVDDLMWESRAVGPPPPPLGQPIGPPRLGLRHHLTAFRHDRRYRRLRLPVEW